MSTFPELIVGIDWARDEHEVCMMDRHGVVVEQGSVKHSGPAIGELVQRLRRRGGGDLANVAVAIEVPRGAIVEALVEAGARVFSINPKQSDRFRDRHFPAGSKDDSKDAFVLADSLRTDRHCFREVRLDDPLVIELREHSRMDDDLAHELNRLTNRFREQLHRYFPQLLLLGSPEEAWMLELLERCPTPSLARKLRPNAVQGILKRNRIRRITADDVVAAINEPDITIAPGTEAAAAAHIAMLIPRVRLVVEQRKQTKHRIEQLLVAMSAPEEDNAMGKRREHRDAEIIQSLPGVGISVAATMLAEAPQPLADRDYHAMRALGGIAPITKASGRRKGRYAKVEMRRGCNPRLRNALYHWARVASMHDPRARERYIALRARGHAHGRALRSVADGLLRILIAMLRDGTVFDPARCSSAELPGSRVAA